MKMINKHLFNQYKGTVAALPAAPVEFLSVDIKDENFQNISSIHPQSGGLLPFARSPIFKTTIKNGRKLTLPPVNDDCKEIFEFWLSVPETFDLGFLPGDSIGIFPTNPDGLVSAMIKAQNWTEIADKTLEITVNPLTRKKNAKVPDFLPKIGSLRNILTYCLDLRSIPKKLFLLACIKYCQNEEDKFILEFLSSKQGIDIYSKEIMEKRVSVMDLLTELDIKLPINVLLEHCLRLLPRPYSIASSNLKSKNEIRIVFSLDSLHPGLTTSMLKRAIEGGSDTKISFYFRAQNDFKLNTEDLKKNLIMIGPGVGVSPFLGFLEQISVDEKSNNNQVERVLYTSSRFEKADNVFEEEFQKHLEEKSLSSFYQSFTREANETGLKEYVQELIYKNRDNFVDLLLNESTKLFVCGEGKTMLPEIEAKIVQCLNEVLPSSHEAALTLFKHLKTAKRIVSDAWI